MNEKRTRVEVLDGTVKATRGGGQVKLGLEEMLAVAEKLAVVGVDYVQAGFPSGSGPDSAFYERASRLSLGKTQLVASGTVRHKDERADESYSLLSLLKADTPVVSLAALASADHLKADGVAPDDNLGMVADSVRFLNREGLQVFVELDHFFDGFRRDPDYATKVLRAAAEAGADRVVLCDTNGGAFPEQVGVGVVAACKAVPEKVVLSVRAHNDGGLAVANTLAAVRAGAAQVQVTVNGLGDRCGQADLVTVVANLGLKLGYDVLREGGLKRLTELSHFVSDQVNLGYSQAQPFVGTLAFAHGAGARYAALRKDPNLYEHVLPEAVGNRRQLLVSDLSGRATLVEKLVSFGLALEGEELVRVHNEVVRREKQGWQFGNADATLHLLALEVLGRRTRWFDVQHYNVLHRGVGAAADGRDDVEAAVKLKVGGDLEHWVSEGAGPVHALDSAMRKALLPRYPDLKDMKLTDYKVQVIPTLGDGEDGEPPAGPGSTSSRVRVTIQAQDADRNTWGTVAVSTNILSASWAALVDVFEYKRLLDMKKVWGGAAPGDRAAG